MILSTRSQTKPMHDRILIDKNRSVITDYTYTVISLSPVHRLQVAARSSRRLTVNLGNLSALNAKKNTTSRVEGKQTRSAEHPVGGARPHADAIKLKFHGSSFILPSS